MTSPNDFNDWNQQQYQQQGNYQPVYEQQPQQYQPAPAPQKSGAGSVLAGIAIGLAVLLVAGGGFFGYLKWQDSRESGELLENLSANSSNSSSAAAGNSGASAPANSAAESTVTASAETTTVVAQPPSVVTVIQQAPAAPAASLGQLGAKPAGLTDVGFSASPATQCAAGEELRYGASRAGSDFVTVCRSAGGGLTYRSDVNGGQLVRPAYEKFRGAYEVNADPSFIAFDNNYLSVVTDGKVVMTMFFDTYWY